MLNVLASLELLILDALVLLTYVLTVSHFELFRSYSFLIILIDTWVEKDETEMASELITGYLIKALNAAANATLQDRAGYAIQEVLKFVGCTNKVLTPNYKVWCKIYSFYII